MSTGTEAAPSAPPGLVERVRTRLVSTGGRAGVDDLAAAVRAEARGVVGDADVLTAVRGLQRELVGAGPLEPLLREPDTSDVLVTGPDAVWVDRGAGLERTAITFPDEDAVRRLAQRLASAAGRRLDDASPHVDARLPGSGVRLHAVLAPVAADGTCISLRVLRPAHHDLATLAATGTVGPDGAALLRAVVAARLAFLVVGGTGSGNPRRGLYAPGGTMFCTRCDHIEELHVYLDHRFIAPLFVVVGDSIYPGPGFGPEHMEAATDAMSRSGG